jgi:hypothetical protein
MTKILRIFALTLALACSVSAGEIPNNVTGAPPPPPPSSDVQEPTTEDGEIPNNPTVVIVEIVLTLLGLP